MIWKGSPVRYDSSITPWPSVTTPSTGQMSWGKITSVSPTATSVSAMSTMAVPLFRWATEGMRFASAASTDDALRSA